MQMYVEGNEKNFDIKNSNFLIDTYVLECRNNK